jgi:DNA-binding MarR family transcriptional regulator
VSANPPSGGPARDTGLIEQAVSRIVAWSTRNDIVQETMRRARCSLPRGGVWLLTRIAETEPVRLSDLSEELGVDNSTLTPQTQRLEKAGYIVRAKDPSDGRASLVRVTRSGRGLLSRLHRTRCAMLDELLADWTDADRTLASETLTGLAERLTGFPVVRDELRPDKRR